MTRNGNEKMNNLGITNLIQSYEFRHTYDKYVALNKIEGKAIYEHVLTSCDLRFIFQERMRYSQIFDCMLLEGDDCMRWCIQANKLIGICHDENVFLPDDIFKLIYKAFAENGRYINVNTFRQF